MSQVCTDCKSDKFVWDWANGDVVCTSCGLVAQERFIDDRAAFKDYDEYAPLDAPTNKTITQHTNHLNAALFNGHLDNTTDMAKTIQDFCNNTPNQETRTKAQRADVLTAAYTNTKGIPAKDLCEALNVKPSTFWKAATKHKVVDKNSSNRPNELLKRTIYENPDIPNGREWSVFKTARKFLEALSATPSIQGIKPDRLAVSLMIIACEVEQVGLKRNKVCHKYRLCLETLSRHEAMLQEALKRGL